ncbi:hypothetical protein AVEN_71475-1 [Araneus ventricosus]|uniref:Uncharacterized protein n=1 Tax=Araneus ventricosus TaxID=182803 RepID=A0A4Y2CUC5_ARAVE|nr:hypothetical protein AVEN_71475-1 [Araneus ventricosus]
MNQNLTRWPVPGGKNPLAPSGTLLAALGKVVDDPPCPSENLLLRKVVAFLEVSPFPNLSKGTPPPAQTAQHHSPAKHTALSPNNLDLGVSFGIVIALSIEFSDLRRKTMAVNKTRFIAMEGVT